MELTPGPQLPTAGSITDSDLQRITFGILQGTYLSVQLECPYHGNSHKECGWTGCPCQPSATGSPPNQDFQKVQSQTPKGMGPGGPGPPRPQRMTQIRAEAGQRVVAQMGTPVCVQWPGSGQNCSDETQNRGNRLDALQRALLMYTSPHVWQMWGPISRRCWILVLSRNHTVHGLAQ